MTDDPEDPRRLIGRLVVHWRDGRITRPEYLRLTSLPLPGQREAVRRAVERADAVLAGGDLFDLV